MRLTRLLAGAAGAALLAGGASEAAALQVRAGEHPAHTRVVIDAPRDLDLRWGVDNRRLAVRAPGADGFDLTPAQGARGLSRVTEFQSEDGGFAVLMSCECGVRATTFGDGRIILDLFDDAPRPPAPRAATSSAARMAPPPRPRPAVTAPPPAATAMAVADSAPEDWRPRGIAGGSESAETAQARTEGTEPFASAAAGAEPLAPAAAASGGEPPAATSEATSPSAEDAIEAARRRLLEQLTKAAEEGFVTLREPEPEPEPADPAPVSAAAKPSAAATPPAAAEALVETPPLRARSALEIAEEDSRAPRPPEVAGRPEGCAPDEALDLAGWGSAEPAAEALARARAALVGEFDVPDGEAVLAYVRLLLHHGLGREARAALVSFETVEAPRLLLDLASVVDGEAAASSGPLARGVGCPGAHGAWAAAAAALAGTLDGARVDVEALRPVLSALPAPFRVWAARPVAEATLDAGAVDAAEALAALAARSDMPPPKRDRALGVLLARINAARGDLARADEALLALVDGGSPAGLEAMIRLVEVRLARGVAPPAGLAEDMEALAFSQRATPLGRRLLEAAATARALGEGVAPALDALRALAARGEAPGLARAAARSLLVSYEPGEDPEATTLYAEAIVEHLDLLGEEPESDPARLAAARRLAERGLGPLAEALVAPAADRGLDAARLAAAEAALASSEPERALARLEGMEGPEVANLRTTALARLFLFGEAAAAAGEAGDPELKAGYAWLAGDWAAAAGAGLADRRVLATWMAGDGEPPIELLREAQADPEVAARVEALAPAAGDGSGGLQAAAAALKEARRRRELMEALLGDG